MMQGDGNTEPQRRETNTVLSRPRVVRTLNEGLGVPLLNMLVPRCIVPARSEPTAFGAEIPPEAVEKWRTRLQKVTVNLEYHVLMRCTRSQEWESKCVFMVTGAQTGEGVTCSMITGANVAVTAWVAAGRTGARIMYISSSAMATLSVTGERRLCGEISATSCASAENSRFWCPPLEFQIEQEVPAHHDIDVPSSGAT